jgi:hypothetical protein
MKTIKLNDQAILEEMITLQTLACLIKFHVGSLQRMCRQGRIGISGRELADVGVGK